MQRIKSWFVTLVVGGFALLGMQLPKITQDYHRQVDIRFSELAEQVRYIEKRAQKNGQDPRDYVQQNFTQNSNTEVAHLGRMMEENLRRYDRMQRDIDQSKRCSPWLKPLHWFWSKDPNIAKETWKVYEFGFVYAWETLLWGVVGASAGWFCIAALSAALKKSLQLAKRARLALAGAKSRGKETMRSYLSKSDDYDDEV